MRPALSGNQEQKDGWKKSVRYKTNPHDEPLNDVGIKESYATGEKILDKIDIDKYEYIYIHHQ